MIGVVLMLGELANPWFGACMRIGANDPKTLRSAAHEFPFQSVSLLQRGHFIFSGIIGDV
jgi:hypothetical protein